MKFSNTNEVEVQPKAVETQSDKSTYAKLQLGARASESKILGLPWDKAKDTLKIVYPQEHDKVTKRSTLLLWRRSDPCRKADLP